MMYAVKDKEIIISQVGDAYNLLSSSGLYRWNRRDKTMRAPLTPEAVDALEETGVKVPPQLAMEKNRMLRRRRMLQQQRECLDDPDSTPKLLMPFPMKVDLMRHQIVGANMAMICFGLLDDEEVAKT